MNTTPAERAELLALYEKTTGRRDSETLRYEIAACNLAPKLVADVVELGAEVERLRTALQTYGEHTVLCKFEVTRKPGSCDCGLDAALAAQGEVKNAK